MKTGSPSEMPFVAAQDKSRSATFLERVLGAFKAALFGPRPPSFTVQRANPRVRPPAAIPSTATSRRMAAHRGSWELAVDRQPCDQPIHTRGETR